MEILQAKCKILKTERKNNSCYGNPSYKLSVLTEDGQFLEGKTSPNAVLGYQCHWTWEGEEKTLAYHFTKNGNLIFDRLVEEVK